MIVNEWQSQFSYKPPSESGWTSCGVRLGKDGANGLEVVWGTGGSHKVTTLRKVWKDRKRSRVNPVVAVHYTENGAIALGPGREGFDPPADTFKNVDQLFRILDTALNLPDRYQARRFLDEYLSLADKSALGIYNSGLLATHALYNISPQRNDWPTLTEYGKKVLDLRNGKLMVGLGFTVEQSGSQHSILRAGDEAAAIALFLERDEAPDRALKRFDIQSPVLYALHIADKENLEWVVITVGSRVRLYPTSSSVGVGSRGRTETFCEISLDLLSQKDAAYLPLLFSSDALCPDGYLLDLIERSTDFVSKLGVRLRERIYEDVIPHLAMAIAKARNLKNPTAKQLEETYEMTLSLLFRLLFIACAEDRKLLPYRENEGYTEASLKTFAHSNSAEQIDHVLASTSLWDQVNSIVNAIYRGNKKWGIPAYGGTPFSDLEEISPGGFRLSKIKLINKLFAPALINLLTDNSEDGVVGPIDFRELSVREFGTIYEGLLESELALATDNLAHDRDKYYRPATDNEVIVVKKGDYYLHNSGKRKSSASYYTKSFAVEHLLNRSLEPALDEHLARIDEIENQQEASKALFDFRVADISMGSGHFLVEAIDRIERRFSDYLSKRPLLSVQEELNRLWRLASENIGKDAEEMGIDHNHLLRRQIARRCIYGVDINPIAVELARVSIWIHTFVPGIPLSFLDWHLRQGNSILGIATQDEANKVIKHKGAQTSIFADFSSDVDEVAAISKQMAEIGEGSDNSLDEVNSAIESYRKTLNRLKPWEALMDIICASRLDDEIKSGLGRVIRTWQTKSNEVLKDHTYSKAGKILSNSPPFHFQIAFPEVFWRENPGFDVIVGNPPWEEVKTEVRDFWNRFIPGLRSLKQYKQEEIKQNWMESRPDLVRLFEEEKLRSSNLRSSLTSGDFPGMETGDPDLYKAFCWRFYFLLRSEGRMGVVLPRSAFVTQGTSVFRKTLLEKALFSSFTMVINNGGWVFEDVHPQYSIVLATLKKQEPGKHAKLPVHGPFKSMEDFVEGTKKQTVNIPLEIILNQSDSATIPVLPTIDKTNSLGMLLQFGQHPRFDANQTDEFRFRPVGEFHATNDKKFMILEKPEAKIVWPIYKGESFDIWNCDTGKYYGYIDPEESSSELNRRRQTTNSRSAFSEMDQIWKNTLSTLPCKNPRIVFRNITNRTNTRTMIASLIPPNVAVSNAAPYLLRIRGNEEDEAFILGILCSIPFDWYSRRYVEINMNFYLIAPFPVPRPETGSALRRRVIELAGRLTAHDSRFASWAMKVGVDHGPLNDTEKRLMILELDAVVAHLYGLSQQYLETLYSTFHHDGTVDGEPWQQRYEAVLEYYNQWAK